MGGSCSSTNLAHSLENRCAGQLRRARASGSISSDSSSSSTSSSSGNNNNDNNNGEHPTADLFKAAATATSAAAAAVTDTNANVNPDGADKDVNKKSDENQQTIEHQAVSADGDEQEQANKTEAAADDETAAKKLRLEKLKEGVDFIETEEDAEAVESAVVKIQSTFRGKKIRSKLGQKQQQQDPAKESDSNNTTTTTTTTATATTTTTKADSKDKEPSGSAASEEEALNKEVASMQVNDNTGANQAPSSAQEKAKSNAPDEDEAERAATKIQAGFKGYKTRKELESKLGAGSGVGSQQLAPDGAE